MFVIMNTLHWFFACSYNFSNHRLRYKVFFFFKPILVLKKKKIPRRTNAGLSCLKREKCFNGKHVEFIIFYDELGMTIQTFVYYFLGIGRVESSREEYILPGTIHWVHSLMKTFASMQPFLKLQVPKEALDGKFCIV